jgi:3-phosphoshikimate 1-carboxyvinyltransferase
LEAKTVTIPKNQRLQGISIDVNDCIDALPILAVIGCFAEGTTHIYNAQIARKKESNRIFAMRSELKKMGAQIEEKEDGLIVQKSSLQGSHLQSYQDHRVALSLSIAALAASGTSKIENVSCIDKTYASFSVDFVQRGARIIQ